MKNISIFKPKSEEEISKILQKKRNINHKIVKLLYDNGYSFDRENFMINLIWFKKIYKFSSHNLSINHFTNYNVIKEIIRYQNKKHKIK